MNSGGPDGVVLHYLLYFPRYKMGTSRSPVALSVQQKFLFQISEIPLAQWNGILGARGREPPRVSGWRRVTFQTFAHLRSCTLFGPPNFA